MPSSPVINYHIELAPTGGFVQGTAFDGSTFNLTRLSADILASVTAILNGPNPEYDAQNRVFSCGRSRNIPLGQPLAVTNAGNPVDNGLF